jgi:hypothetical protein
MHNRELSPNANDKTEHYQCLIKPRVHLNNFNINHRQRFCVCMCAPWMFRNNAHGPAKRKNPISSNAPSAHAVAFFHLAIAHRFTFCCTFAVRKNISFWLSRTALFREMARGGRASQSQRAANQLLIIHPLRGAFSQHPAVLCAKTRRMNHSREAAALVLR